MDEGYHHTSDDDGDESLFNMATMISKSPSKIMDEEEVELVSTLEDLECAGKENKRKKALIEAKVSECKKLEKEILLLKKELEKAMPRNKEADNGPKEISHHARRLCTNRLKHTFFGYCFICNKYGHKAIEFKSEMNRRNFVKNKLSCSFIGCQCDMPYLQQCWTYSKILQK